MNERIKELWSQTTGSVWPRPGKFTAGEYDIHLQRFAESIIKECVHVGSVAFYNDNSVLPVFPGEKIKEHFGVKE